MQKLLMKNNLKSRICWFLGTIVALGICFLLCRYVFWGLHGMRQWTFILFAFGLIVILIAAITDARKVMLGTVGGYIIGFGLGMMLQTDTFHPDRGIYGDYTNNAWVIWTSVYLVFIALSIIWEVIGKRLKNASR